MTRLSKQIRGARALGIGSSDIILLILGICIIMAWGFA